jgi:hypothetical protein
VRLQTFGERHGLRASGGFTDHVHILRGPKHRLEACTHHTVVVGEYDSN